MRPARRRSSAPFLGAATAAACAAAARRRGGGPDGPRPRPRPARPGRRRSVSVGAAAGAARSRGGGRRRLRPRAASRDGPRGVRGASAPGDGRRRPRPPCAPLPRPPLPRGLLGRAARLFLGGFAGLFLAPARLLGGGQDRDLLLLAALGLAPRGLALLLDQRALARGQFGRGQRAPAPGRRAARRRGRRAPVGPGRPACGERAARRAGASARRALLAHLDLHHLRAAMAEALPHGTRVDGPPELQPSRGPQREPALAAVLIVAFAHAVYPLAPDSHLFTGSFLSRACGRSVRPQSGQPRRLDREHLGQPPRRNRHMHHMVAAEHPSQRRRRKRSATT